MVLLHYEKIFYGALLLAGVNKLCDAFTFHSGRLPYVNYHVSGASSNKTERPRVSRDSSSLYAHKEAPQKLAEQVGKGFAALLLSVGIASQTVYAEAIETLDFSMVC